MLGRQHRDVGVDCVGEGACGMLLLPTRQHGDVEKGAPIGALLAAAAAALRAQPRPLRVLVVSGRCGEARAVDDHAVSDDRFEGFKRLGPDKVHGNIRLALKARLHTTAGAMAASHRISRRAGRVAVRGR